MMQKNILLRYKFAFLLLAAISFTNTALAQTRQPIIWGINGHPLMQEAYLQQQPQFKNGLADQLNAVKYIGLSYYRVGIPIDDNGALQTPERFAQLIALAAQKNVKLLPIIRLAGLVYEMPFQAAYDQGLKVGKAFTRSNGKYFSYFELGNEEEGASLIGGAQSDGNVAANYDRARIAVLAAYLKGMIAGIKSVKPTAKIIINSSGWVHFGYLDLLQSEGVKYDILGYHWYSDMGKLSNVNRFGFNIINVLYNKYKKPIWFTEIGKRSGSKNNGEQEQANWAATYIKEAKANPHVQAVFFYELYDESNFEPSDEASYGFIKWGSRYLQPSYKPVAQVVKSLIKAK